MGTHTVDEDVDLGLDCVAVGCGERDARRWGCVPRLLFLLLFLRERGARIGERERQREIEIHRWDGWSSRGRGQAGTSRSFIRLRSKKKVAQVWFTSYECRSFSSNEC